jgi:Ca-activated chloride channel homolog
LNSNSRTRAALTVFVTSFGVIGLLLLSSLAHSQSSPDRTAPSEVDAQHKISVKSELVVLPVNVTDTKGNFVSGLNASDFRVYEDRRLQNLTLFEEEDTPVSVGLVVDHSASMKTKLPNVATAISAFAHSGNPEDEMFVVDFNDRVTLQPLGGKAFTNDSEELTKAVDPISADGRTALYDAIAEGLAHLQLSRQQRKALIVISDGGDNASDYKYSQILQLARRSQVMIYSLALVDRQTKEQRPQVLRRLSRDTGGAALFPDSEQSVIDCSAKVALDLREQYVLGFVPEKQEGGNAYRKVQVRVNSAKGGELHVRTRSGYFASSESAALFTTRMDAQARPLASSLLRK